MILCLYQKLDTWHRDKDMIIANQTSKSLFYSHFVVLKPMP